MPGFDRSGPMGEGSMTGGGRGHCNPANAGYGRPFSSIGGVGRGRGFGRGARGTTGMGMGRGFGWGAAQNQPVYTESSTGELDALKTEMENVKTVLETINRRISELE
ncbi:MAG: DUF5320 domain-containing protein [Deltaproteobacteria bacterium]|nr:DUF5320 domain-containing protein [Deltaproteobacteria bacterium]